MVTIEEFVNTVIPIVIVAIGLYFFYKVLKQPLDAFFGLFKSMFSRFGHKEEEVSSIYPEIMYE